RARWRQIHNIPQKDLLIVSTARLSIQKRIDRLLQAFSFLSSKHKNMWLMLAGDGPLRAELERSIDTLPNRRIKILGHVDDVTSILQASDIYVLPSDNEGFGIALIEAMATKLVCVATRTAGPDDIIEDGENGFLVDLSYEGVLSGLEKAIEMSPSERD